MASVGLMYYRSRWLDPEISHFTAADTLVPDAYDPLSWDRYLYVRGNPIRYTDPTGHCIFSSQGKCYVEDDGSATYAPAEEENWKVLVLTAVIYKETEPKQSLYPSELSSSIAWTYLNRTVLVNRHKDNLWAAVKGKQSALVCIYNGCGGWPEISHSVKKLPDNPSPNDLFEYFSYVLDQGI